MSMYIEHGASSLLLPQRPRSYELRPSEQMGSDVTVSGTVVLGMLFHLLEPSVSSKQ